VLGSYGAIMIYHDLTWFNQQKCWFNGDLRYGCSDLTRKKNMWNFMWFLVVEPWWLTNGWLLGPPWGSNLSRHIQTGVFGFRIFCVFERHGIWMDLGI
jgi:hypothetical protein